MVDGLGTCTRCVCVCMCCGFVVYEGDYIGYELYIVGCVVGICSM